MWSVIVVARGMWPVTERFLNSLEETIGVEHEIIYIDNGSPDQSSWFHANGWLIERFGKNSRNMLVVVYPGDGHCLSKCWNEGARHAKGERVLISNNDIVFQKSGWCETFQAGLDELGVGIVGMTGMSWRNIPFIQGSLFAMKKSTYEEVGSFDERYPFTCEDVDYCKRLQDLGMSIKSYEGLRNDGTIEHAEGATRNFYTDRTIEMQRRAHISRIEFCYKWTYPDVSIHD